MWNRNSKTIFVLGCAILLIGNFVSKVFGDEESMLEIAQGSLKGLKTKTVFHEKTYYSFKGIPYAKPPVGVHKFDPPVAADPWVGQLDATKHRSTCIFYCMIRQGIFGDEDCLYLNVYTPEPNKDAKRAVMVFIHPGGFAAGSGDDDVFGPDFLVEQDVVVVTFNSRLGAAGFLNTGDVNAPGNAGMKDQVMVLKWVKDNIVNFGGCPNRVTIFGCSSGGAAVQFHLLSSMSRGLFKSAISESGSALNPWAMTYNPKDMAFKLGEVLGIKTSDTKELVDKLKEISLQEIVGATSEIAKSLNRLGGHLNPFTPSVEPDVGQEIFLPNDPWLMFKTDSIADVPYMAGNVLDETSFMVPMFLQAADAINQHLELMVPEDLNVTDAQKKDLAGKIKQFYFGGKPVAPNTKDELTKLTSDLFFNAGVLISSRVISSRIKSPVFEYLFSYYSPVGLMKNLFKTEEGVPHGDELTHLFYSNVFKNKPQPGSANEKMAATMSKMWANFAKDGNPTSSMDDDVTVGWTQLSAAGEYLEINQPAKMGTGIMKDRVGFWAQIYADVLGDLGKLFA